VLISVILPVYNEEENIPELYERLKTVSHQLNKDYQFEFIFSDDHSNDDSFNILKKLADEDKRVKIVRLAHNTSGHYPAWCGLQYAKGEAVILMASDLQDPPEKLPELINKWREGYDIVWGRRSSKRDPLFTKATSFLYAHVIRLIAFKNFPTKGRDIVLLNKKVTKELQKYKERNSSIINVIMWLGFTSTEVDYNREARKYGDTKFNFKKRVKIGIDSLLSESYLPVRIIFWVGLLMLIASAIFGLLIISDIINQPSSIFLFVLALFGFNFLFLGISSEFLARIHEQTRGRPIWVVEEKININGDTN